MIKVKITRSEACKCDCKTWENHWQNNSKRGLPGCSVKDCQNIDISMYHVNEFSVINNDKYIIPLCKEHSKTPNAFSIESRNLIESKKLSECGNPTGISLM